MNRQLLEKIIRNDLERSSIHEAAHHVLLENAGGVGIIELFDSDIDIDSEDVLREFRLVTGHVKIYRLARSDEDMRWVGLAGRIAEIKDAYDKGDFWLHDPAEIREELEIGGDYEMSATDFEDARGFTVEDVVKTVALVDHYWDQITTTAAFKRKAFILDGGGRGLL